ncbi:hypothetical protein [Streptomyces sp. NPDC088915]|uniref:hypothetical protein n=1 Tax=Streptomyces sp. NPDC088915 TaxID=3365912 RepID=UPI003821363F
MQGDLAGIGEDGAVVRAPLRLLPSRVLGTLLGCATALAGALRLLVTGAFLGPLLLGPRTRPAALEVLTAGARRLAALERARRSVFFGDRFPERYEASDRKVLRYLTVRVGTGLLCGVVVALLGFGAFLAWLLAAGAVRGTLGRDELLGQALLGGVLLFLDVQGRILAVLRYLES